MRFRMFNGHVSLVHGLSRSSATDINTLNCSTEGVFIQFEILPLFYINPYFLLL